VAYSIKTRKLKPKPVVGTRLRTTPAGIGPAFQDTIGQVMAYVESAGAAPAGPPFIRYFDYDEDEVDMEVGVPLDAPLPGSGVIQASELPGGRVAITVHEGDYSGLDAAHDALSDWVLSNDRDTKGPVWEVYTVNAWADPDPAAWRTEIVWPLR
jgi:effector-binding domain-containing protein